MKKNGHKIKKILFLERFSYLLMALAALTAAKYTLAGLGNCSTT
jgi:hypothetical protein